MQTRFSSVKMVYLKEELLREQSFTEDLQVFSVARNAEQTKDNDNEAS